MNRNYDNGTSDAAVIFTGYEIENTPAKGLKTLFVVGIQPADELISIAQVEQCDHIYLGANHSFQAISHDDIVSWEKMIDTLLKKGYWVTLDFDIKHSETVLEMLVVGHNKFIPVISCKIPYVSHFGYNACVKIDDKDFKASNPGVWVHSLHDLQDRSKFTHWELYAQDRIIK